MNFFRKIFISFIVSLIIFEQNLLAVYVDEKTEYVWSDSSVETASVRRGTKRFSGFILRKCSFNRTNYWKSFI